MKRILLIGFILSVLMMVSGCYNAQTNGEEDEIITTTNSQRLPSTTSGQSTQTTTAPIVVNPQEDLVDYIQTIYQDVTEYNGLEKSYENLTEYEKEKYIRDHMINTTGYDVEFNKVTASMSYDDLTSFGVNDDIFYPGALVQLGNGKTTNEISTLRIPRGNYTIRLQGIAIGASEGSTSKEVSNANSAFDGVNTIVNNIVNDNAELAYKITSRVIEIESEKDLEFAFNAEVNTIPANFKTGFKFDEQSNNKYQLLMIKQVYFSIIALDQYKVMDYFDSSVSLEDLKYELKPNNVPAYVNRVDYGRLIMVKITTNKTSQEILADISGTISEMSQDMSVIAELDVKLSQYSSTRDYFIYGGSAESSKAVFTQNEIQPMLTSLTDDVSARDMVGVPIAYHFRYLDNSNAKISNTNTYITATKTPKILTGMAAVELNNQPLEGDVTADVIFKDDKGTYKTHYLKFKTINDYGQYYSSNSNNLFEIKLLDPNLNEIGANHASISFYGTPELNTDEGTGLYTLKVDIQSANIGKILVNIKCGKSETEYLEHTFMLNVIPEDLKNRSVVGLDAAITEINTNSLLEHLTVKIDINKDKNKELKIPANVQSITLIGDGTNDSFVVSDIKIIFENRNSDVTLTLNNIYLKGKVNEDTIDASRVTNKLIINTIGNSKIVGGAGMNGQTGTTHDPNTSYPNSSTTNLNGGNGVNGTSGKLAISANNVVFAGSKTLTLIGGKGGDGGAGGNGGVRRPYDYQLIAVAGFDSEKTWVYKGTSGKGGSGGNGGAGGNAILVNASALVDDNAASTFQLVLIPGDAGSGGIGGNGGHGYQYYCHRLHDLFGYHVSHTMRYTSAGAGGSGGIKGASAKASNYLFNDSHVQISSNTMSSSNGASGNSGKYIFESYTSKKEFNRDTFELRNDFTNIQFK